MVQQAIAEAVGAERERAGAAERKLAELIARAEEWAARAPADDWGLTPVDTVTADCGRAVLAIIGTEERGDDSYDRDFCGPAL